MDEFNDIPGRREEEERSYQSVDDVSESREASPRFRVVSKDPGIYVYPF